MCLTPESFDVVTTPPVRAPGRFPSVAQAAAQVLAARPPGSFCTFVATAVPCPWCGSTGSARRRGPERAPWTVVCDGPCGAQGPTASTPRDAVAAWEGGRP